MLSNAKQLRHQAMCRRLDRNIAEQIKATRLARGWTQQELASRMGVTQETVAVWERPTYGRYSLATLIRLATVFDVALVARFQRHSHDELGVTAVPAYDNEERE